MKNEDSSSALEEEKSHLTARFEMEVRSVGESAVPADSNDQVEVKDEQADFDEAASELLAGEESMFWINGALIRQERLPLYLEKDQACLDIISLSSFQYLLSKNAQWLFTSF